MTIPSEVKPGQLITAAFMNDILAELVDIRAQLASLPGSTTSGLAILSLVPGGGSSDPIIVGSELRIIGQEFRFSAGGHRVSFDGFPVNQFEQGSGDTILIVHVPQPPGPPLPVAGRGVVLRVENGLAAVNRVVTIRPAQVTPQGGIDVTWRDDIPNPVPNPITAGAPASFAYRIHSLANLAAEFAIGVVPNPGTFQATLVDTNGTPIPNNRVALEPGATRDVVVRIALPTGSDGTAFNLSVTATVPGAGAGFQSGSDSRGFTVGAAAEPSDATIDLGSPVFSAIDPATGNVNPNASFNSGTNTISLPAGALGTMQFTAQFQTQGVYDLTVEVPAGTSGWTLNRVPATHTETASHQGESIRFTLQASNAATTPVEVTYRVLRQGAAAGQVRRFTAVRT